MLAAGGIVWRDSSRGRELVVIHRPRYDDWTLPKGKLQQGERWQKAARREVREETGFDVELRDFAGACGYMTRNAPKTVLFWHMELVGEPRFEPEDPKEVDAVEWLSVPEAIRKLTHVPEKRLLAEATAPQGPPMPEASGSEVVAPPFRQPQPAPGTVTAKRPVAPGAGAPPTSQTNDSARASGKLKRSGDDAQSRRGFLTRILGSRDKRR